MTESPRKDATVEITLHGHRVLFHLPDLTDHIQKRIAERKTFYEVELLEDMRARVTRGGLCVDVGAHLGNHSVFLAKLCGMRVISFEPQPDIFALLEKNLALNGLGGQVTAINAALGETTGHGTMARALVDNTGTAKLALDDGGSVPVLTLDEQIGDREVDLIKIDVEGFELEVLKGGARTIERDRPIIYAEAQDEASRKVLETFLAPRGYVVADVFAGTPVVAFVPVGNDDQRFAALASRLSRAHKETANALEKAVRHGERDSDRRIAELTATVDRLERRLAAVGAGVEARLAGAIDDRRLLYQAWAAAAAAAGSSYRPLSEAGELADWKPRRPSWTIPKGAEAESFLQGFTDEISVQPGGVLSIRLSTDRPQLFAKIRLFRVGAFGKRGGEEVYASPAVYVPETGVAKPGSGDIDLGRWHVVQRVPIRDTWKPGCYIARFETIDGAAVLHPFWITSPHPSAPMAVLSSTLSHIAGNTWGSSGIGKAVRRALPGFDRLRTIRLCRPYAGSRGGGVVRYEVAFARWADGVDLPIDWITDLDVHRRPELLAGYSHVVLVGDTGYATAEVIDALRGVRDRGGSLTVLGAAPGEHEVTVDLEAGTMSPRAESSTWRRSAADLWLAERHAIVRGPAHDLKLRDEPPVPALFGHRVSGSGLSDDDPGLLGRTVHGNRICDTVLVTTPQGGQLFVAGTDRWGWALDDFVEHAGVSVSPAVERLTARVLGSTTDARNPLVSVVITAYDSAAFIGAAIDSILAQSYRDLELIVVDDASRDDTFGVLLDYARKDPRVRPFRSLVNHGTYWCKNFGISQARGELVTFQDSDDVSLPDRLKVQVEAMRRHRTAVLSVVDYVRVDGQGAIQMNRGVWQRRAFQTQMIRKDEVISRIGYFDGVRSAADQEFFHRIRLVFGLDKVIEVKTALYHATIREGSLTMNAENFVRLDGDGAPDDRLGHLSETRKRYVLGYEAWHRRISDGQASPIVDFPLRERTFPAPPEMGVETGRKAPIEALDPAVVEARIREHELASIRHTVPAADREDLVIGLLRDEPEPARRGSDEVDVLIVSDFRFPGGTSHSNAEEIKALARAGRSIGLIQVASPTLKRDHPINPVIRACVEAGLARWMTPRRPARCRLAVVRHPTVLQTRDPFPTIEAARLAVIVNQAPVEVRDGRVLYDLVACQANARRYFAMPGTWFPIGPLVRAAVQGIAGVTDLAADDWHNIIDLDEWRVERRGWVSDRPVIGRHSRDGAEKWPDDIGELRHAYPDDGSVKVRILGGASHPKKLLGTLPATWEVLEFNSIPQREFLAGIDFFVYYHHPGLAEAFGRAILEAIATGAVAILPPHFEVLFGDAATYARPEDVQRIVQELYQDRTRYDEKSRRGLEILEERFSYQAHVRRVEALLGRHAEPSPSPRPVAAAAPAGRTIGTAEVAAHGAYKIEVDLAGLPAGARGTVRGVSRATGKRLFELPVNGAPTVSTNFLTEDHADHVDLLLAIDGGEPEPITAAFKMRRRGDRPVLPSLELGDTSVTAALATYPGRRQVAPEVIDRLTAQCDKVFVYLNNYTEVPSFIAQHPRRDKLVFILDPGSQKRAAAKFNWLTTVRGYHLICDDDILYPPDYASRMVAAIERHRRRAIVGVHGVVFEPEIRDARSSRRSTFKFPEALAADTPVHFLGTGTVALHTDLLRSLDLTLFDAYPIANDEILAVSAKEAGVPMICIERSAGWLDPHAQVKYGIFEERSIDTGEHDKASQLLASANPWPDPRVD